jgi:hypothetical protein
MTGWPTILGGSGSREPLTASRRRCGPRRGSIARTSGLALTPISRSGSRRTPWPASSFRSRPSTTCPSWWRAATSLSFLHGAAEYINALEVPTYIYHLGDFDPSGVNAGEKIEETLREMAPDADITFERLAVTEEQIAEWRLPSRPTKSTDSRSRGFGEISVELDAIEPDLLRALVQDAIENHLPPEQFNILKIAEQSEREIITKLVGGLGS